MSIYERIIELINDKNISINKLENFLDLPTCSISKWKDDKIKPSLVALQKIADFFDISIDWLVGREYNKENNILHVKHNEQRFVELMKQLNIEKMTEEQFNEFKISAKYLADGIIKK